MKFNSQICTTREQSERLLALGVKEETADFPVWGTEKLLYMGWSLHRLIEMIQEVCKQVIIISHRVDIRSNVKRIAYSFDVCDNLYDNIIDGIEWLIKEGYFNKEYLV